MVRAGRTEHATQRVFKSDARVLQSKRIGTPSLADAHGSTRMNALGVCCASARGVRCATRR